MSSACHGSVPNKSNICGSLVFRCTKCGAVGCTKNGCSNQKFKDGQCMSCGSHGTKKEV